MKSIIAALAAFIIVLATPARAELIEDNIRVIRDSLPGGMEAYKATKIMSIEFGALGTYGMSGFRIRPVGNGDVDSLYCQFYIVAEDGKLLGTSDSRLENGEYVVKSEMIITKGLPKKVHVIAKVDYWGDDTDNLGTISFAIFADKTSSVSDVYPNLYATSNWFDFTYKGGGGIYTNNIDAEIKPELRVAERGYLGGVEYSAYGEDVFMYRKPSFRIYYSKGKASDIHRLELVNEFGEVVSKKPKISDRGDYALVTFQTPVKIENGQTRYYVRGALGRSFAKGGIATLTISVDDQYLPLGLSGEMYAIDVWGGSTVLGTVRVK